MDISTENLIVALNNQCSAKERDDYDGQLMGEAADEIERLRSQVEQTRAAMSFLGHVVVAAGGKVRVPQKQLTICRYPMMTRTDDASTGDRDNCHARLSKKGRSAFPYIQPDELFPL